MDDDELYPWGGSFETGRRDSPVAIVTLAEDWDLKGADAAIWGKMKTENLGIEHVVANIISNPCIRFLMVAGREIRGHRAGQSIIALHGNGMDGEGRITGAGGAVPYIENLDHGAVERWRSQVEIVDMLECTDPGEVEAAALELAARDPGPYPDGPYQAIRRRKVAAGGPILGGVALHRTMRMDPFGQIERFRDERAQEGD